VPGSPAPSCLPEAPLPTPHADAAGAAAAVSTRPRSLLPRSVKLVAVAALLAAPLPLHRAAATALSPSAASAGSPPEPVSDADAGAEAGAAPLAASAVPLPMQLAARQRDSSAASAAEAPTLSGAEPLTLSAGRAKHRVLLESAAVDRLPQTPVRLSAVDMLTTSAAWNEGARPLPTGDADARLAPECEKDDDAESDAEGALLAIELLRESESRTTSGGTVSGCGTPAGAPSAGGGELRIASRSSRPGASPAGLRRPVG
jgi:hypothetical protein